MILDRSAPGVRVTLLPDEQAEAGEPLDLDGRILAFTFEDTEGKADQVSIQLDNFDLSLFDREDLAGGAVLEVSWGYPGHMAPPRRVVVRRLKGFTTLTLEGRATSVLMDREAKTRAWESMSRSEIARAIAEEHGYQGSQIDVEDTGEALDVVNQVAETDARFLRRLAGREELEFYVDDGGFHFHQRRHSDAPTHVFTWYADPERGDVLSIHVDSELGRRTGRVTVRGRDPLTRSTLEAIANNDSAERQTLAEVVEVVDPETGTTTLQTRNATASVRPTSATTATRAEAEAQARFRRAERGTVKLSMQVVGDPSLRAKTVVEVRGISGLLSGKYYLTDVKHLISSSGYVCELKLTRDGSGQRARPAAQEQQGEHNRNAPSTGGAMTEVEVVDPETGATQIEYRSDGQSIGADDPEAQTGGASEGP